MDERAQQGAEHVAVGDGDAVTGDDIRALASASDGPKVSIHLPTHRLGAEVRQDPVRCRHLTDDAAHQLHEAGHGADVDALLGPTRALLDDGAFWQHQSDGLAIFASRDVHRTFRVPIDLPAVAVVGSTFHVTPLAPLLSGDGEFLVLALSQNSVRLFAASRSTMSELDTGVMPTSIAEALAHEDPERHLQARSVGGGDSMFHGHGVGEQDKGEIERFLRAVDHGLHDVIGADRRPLVLACVAYYAPIFRSVSRHTDVIEPSVEGNPEHTHANDLHAAAWELVAPRFSVDGARAWERLQAASGTGTVTDSPDDIAARATEGRVDTLFVTASCNGTDAADLELVDRAVVATLGASGRVVAKPPADLAGRPAVALLRY